VINKGFELIVSTYPFFPPRFLLLGLSITSGGGSGALKPNVDMIFIVILKYVLV
jgi:hypothetical protein